MGGASKVPCTDTFAGREPYTEPEVKALVDYYEKVHEKVKIYLAFHSAAEMILYPMGHTGTFEEVPNVADLVSDWDEILSWLVWLIGSNDRTLEYKNAAG